MNKDLDSAEYKVLVELYNLEEQSLDTNNYFDAFSKFEYLLNLLEGEVYNDYINILLSLNEANYIDLDISSESTLKNMKMNEFLEENDIEDIDVEELKLTYEGRKVCRVHLENQLKAKIDAYSGKTKEELLTLLEEIKSALATLDSTTSQKVRVSLKERLMIKVNAIANSDITSLCGKLLSGVATIASIVNV